MIQGWQIKAWLIAHPWTVGIAGVILAVVLVSTASWWTAQRYDKGRLQYEADSKAWATERAGLLSRVAERDAQIEQLKAKEAAYIAADQAGKKVDDALAKKIDDVTKAAAAEQTAVDQPADCFVRADRTCSRLAGLQPPIRIDCDAYKRKLCFGQ